MPSEQQYARTVLSFQVALINDCARWHETTGEAEPLVMGRVSLRAFAGMLSQFVEVGYLDVPSRREFVAEVEPSIRSLFGTSGTIK